MESTDAVIPPYVPSKAFEDDVQKLDYRRLQSENRSKGAKFLFMKVSLCGMQCKVYRAKQMIWFY